MRADARELFHTPPPISLEASRLLSVLFRINARYCNSSLQPHGFDLCCVITGTGVGVGAIGETGLNNSARSEICFLGDSMVTSEAQSHMISSLHSGKQTDENVEDDSSESVALTVKKI